MKTKKTAATATATTTTTADAEIEAYRSRIKDLEGQVEDLQQAAEYAQTRHDDENWLREQLDTLAIDVDTSSAPQNHDQWRRCLKGIAGGDDWRYGTWR
jgi:hypothetical protein